MRDKSLQSCRSGRGTRSILLLGLVMACGLIAAPRPARAQEEERHGADAARSHPEEWGPRAGGGRHGGLQGLGLLRDPERLIEKLTRDLELAESQRTELEALADRFRAENAGALARLRELSEQIHARFQAGTRPSREELRELAGSYGFPLQELRPALQALREEVRALLTPDQRERLDELRERHREHGRRRWRAEHSRPD